MLVLMIEINSRSFQRVRRSRPTIKGSWHYESLTNFAECDAFRSVARGGREAFDWFSQWLETEPERLMMHRHYELRAGGVGHLDRLLRRAMVPDPWVVSCDRYDREIDGPVLAKLGKSVRERGVPSEQDAPSVSLHKIAIVTAMGVALHSRAPVFHFKGADENIASRCLGIIPLQGLGFCESGSDRAPAFDCPFTPKMREPTAHPRAAQSWLIGCIH